MMPTISNASSGVKFVSNLDQVRPALLAGYKRNLTKAALIWERSIKQTLAGQRSGRQYLVPGTAVRYTASKPGEAPANRLGGLRASYATDVDAVSVAALNAYLGSPLDYSLWLERGTKNTDGSVRIAPRPALKPSFDKVQAQIASALREPING